MSPFEKKESALRRDGVTEKVSGVYDTSKKKKKSKGRKLQTNTTAEKLIFFCDWGGKKETA